MQRPITIAGQTAFCIVIGIVAFIGLPVGNGWELIVLPILFTLECLLIGWFVGQIFNNPPKITPMLFIVTLALSGLGAAILNIPGAWGFQGLFFPIAGAVVGYQLVARA